MISAWWAGLSLAMKVLWGITLTASLIFVIQTIATFIGADADTDFDIPDGNLDTGITESMDPGMNLLTFRNFVNFFLGFGWSAILLKDSIQSKGVLLLVAILIGVALVAMVMYLFNLLNGSYVSVQVAVFHAAERKHQYLPQRCRLPGHRLSDYPGRAQGRRQGADKHQRGHP